MRKKRLDRENSFEKLSNVRGAEWEREKEPAETKREEQSIR